MNHNLFPATDGVIMDELRLIYKIEGFNFVYKSQAEWENFKLSKIEDGKGIVEAWAYGIDDIEKLQKTKAKLKEKVESFILAIEWNYGCELNYSKSKTIYPLLFQKDNTSELDEKLELEDMAVYYLADRNIPEEIPQVPIEAKKWIKIWLECSKFDEYVEEQLRRYYLIIEELWDEFNHKFDQTTKVEKNKIKLIRDFVSHAYCENKDIISLVEYNLPSAVKIIKQKKRIIFQRTDEHRNYIAPVAGKSKEIARKLISFKMKQFGNVSGV